MTSPRLKRSFEIFWESLGLAAHAVWTIPHTQYALHRAGKERDLSARQGGGVAAPPTDRTSQAGSTDSSSPTGDSKLSKSSGPSRRQRSNASRATPIFLYSQVAWDDVWQRPQEMAAGLSRTRPVVYFSPVQVHHATGLLKGKWEAQRKGPGDGDLTIASPRIFPGEYKSPVVRLLNRSLIVAEARRVLLDLQRRAGPGLIFITNSPFCDYLPATLHPDAVVYDIIDDFVAFRWAPPDGLAREQHIIEWADLIFTGTNSLLQKKTTGHPNAQFIACGVDFERFAAGKEQEEPPELKGLPRPILGYMGTLSDRLDRRLIEGLARRFPQASVVMVGPVHGSFGPPVEAPNLHYLGLRRPEALPAYAARFDVALMPFAQTEAARAINPVKTLEYLAAGRPVISTPIPDVEKFYGDVVVIAEAVEPFLEAVEKALNETPEERKTRVRRGLERARARSWEAMTREMVEKLQEIEPAEAE